MQQGAADPGKSGGSWTYCSGMAEAAYPGTAGLSHTVRRSHI